jgi:sorbitol-specific phosphotransferase system component IIC
MEGVKTPLDVTAGFIAVGTVVEILPAIASVLTIIWMVIRIIETDTVQKLLGRKNGD